MRETDEKYRNVALSVQNITEPMRQIAGASNGQALGIEHINKAGARWKI